MSKLSAHRVAAVFIAISAALTFINIRPSPLGSANPKSRFAHVHCLVDYGSFAIEKSPYKGTMDRIKKDGHLYSSKPPLLSTMVAGIYGTYHALTGRTMKSHEKQAVSLCIFFSVFILHLAMLIVFWLFSGRIVTDVRARLFALAGLCFTWIGMGYATDLNNHTVSASLALSALYFAHLAKTEKHTRYFLLSGLCAGFLPTVDIPALFFSSAIFIYLLRADVKKALTLFVSIALVPLLAHFALTYSITGSILPAYMQHDLYERPLREWTNTINVFEYAFHAFLGHHGLFSMTPIFCFSLYGIKKAIEDKELRSLALVVAIPFCILCALYFSGNRNYGGTCVGFRWFLGAGPMLFLFAAVAFEKIRFTTLVTCALFAAFLVGGINAQNALYNPWRKSRWQGFVEGFYR